MPRNFIGTKQEEKVFTEVIKHYDDGRADLDTRIRGMDKKDELFRSHINEAGWPYQAMVFDPRVFTTIFEKTSRLFARKPRAKTVPRSGGDELGAKVVNELLSFQWDDNERVDSAPMISKWAMMDMNTRKYGASFALCKWHYETFADRKSGKKKCWYDGPNFKPWNNRDVLLDNSFSYIKNWVQLRDYVTVQDLERVNDQSSTGEPIYKNVKLLKRKMIQDAQKGDSRAINSKNKSISGIQDNLGNDSMFKTIEVVTEYRRDRWVTFSPKHGVILRDVPNPYDHGQIPVVILKYYPIDDDIYGLSEIEPIEKLQRAINSLVCQYIDSVNMGLYPIIKVRSQGVQMHTLEWGPGKKWIMDNPDDVVAHEQGTSGIAEFTSTYRFLVSALQEAVGETSAGISNMIPGSGDKTATEVQDTAIQRNARDNFNQIFLSEALKKQMSFWMSMDSQFLFSSEKGRAKVIRISDRDAVEFFKKIGLTTKVLDKEHMDVIMAAMQAGANINPEDFAQEASMVNTEEGSVPKFTLDKSGTTGYLLLEEDDLAGTYDYIPDIESMSLPNDSQMAIARQNLFTATVSPVVRQNLMMSGWKMNTKELLEDTYELLGIKNPEKYFEAIQETNANTTGNSGTGGSQEGTGVEGTGGMESGAPTAAPAEVPEQLAGPQGMPQ
jgi:hypothetical protein